MISSDIGTVELSGQLGAGQQCERYAPALQRPGARFSKVPRTFQAGKASRKTTTCYSVKLVFSSVGKGIKVKITA